MSGNPPSAFGFGHQPFGHHPFGSSDWAEEVFWRSIPEFYREADVNAPGNVPNPLRGFVDAIKPFLEELRIKFQNFPKLMNADEAPVDFLPPLARIIGLQPTTDKDEVFQRLEILNANQLFLFKGTDTGYQIVASFDGLVVNVEALWAATCEPDAVLSTQGPRFWMPNFDDIPADVIHTDSIYTDRFAIWPWLLCRSVELPGFIFFDDTALDVIPLDSGAEITDGPCRSHSLRLTFSKPDNTEIEDYNNVVTRVLKFLEFMRPAHVEFDEIKFDGPKGAATWVSTISGGNPGGAVWVSPITGTTPAAATWVSSITGATP